MFSWSNHFLISGLHAGNTKIKGQPHWVVLLDLCQLFPSMHDYCFLPCMWHQVIDLFPSKQAGIAGMTVSFSIAQGIAWPEGRSLAWSLSIVFFHAWLLFPSMYVASGDRFVSFKTGGDRRDGSFFFYRAGYRMAGREEQPKKKVAQKNSLTFNLFSGRRYRYGERRNKAIDLSLWYLILIKYTLSAKHIGADLAKYHQFVQA